MGDVLNDVIVDEMVLDMDKVDFFSLEDTNISVKEPTNKTSQSKESTKAVSKKEVAEVEEVEDSEDSEEDGDNADDFDFDDINENEDEEGEVEDSEDSDEDSEGNEEDGEVEDTDSDEEEVDYEGYEVTLPSGETVKLADAVKGYKEAQKLEQERKEFETIRDKFTNESKNTTRYLELAKLEAQRVIEDYEDFDWIELAKNDHSAYVDNKIFLEKYQQRYNEISEAMDEIRAKEEEEKKSALQEQARNCLAVLEKDLPGWGEPLYRQLMEYAVENGASSDDIVNCTDPMVFKVLHKALQFDKGKATVKAKVKKAVTSPTKVVKATAKTEKTPDSKKTVVVKKVKSGQLDSRDVSAMFDMLED